MEGDGAFRGLQATQHALKLQRGVVDEQDPPEVVDLFELLPTHPLQPSGGLMFRVRDSRRLNVEPSY
jgi:hypothetical protein